MKRAVDYLLQCGVETIKLEAVPEMAELYRKLGFIDECDSLRFSKTLAKPDLQAKDGLAPIKKENISEIAEFDEKFFGANRTKVLASLFKENTQLCLAAYDREAVDGYIMCRKAKNGFKIGPFVCNPENTQTADDLLQALANRLVSTTLYVGLPATNKNAVDLLTKRGFTRYSMSIRMRLGQELKNERVQGVFGIGGPMKG